MKRVFASIALVAALSLFFGLPHGGMDMAGASTHMAGHCAEGACAGDAQPDVTDCADRCLAAGPVRAVGDAAANLALASLALVFLAVANGTRRPKPSVSPGTHVSLGRSLVLERVATDVMRN